MQLEQGVVSGIKEITIPTHRTAKHKSGLRELFRYLGPAFIVSVAYMDPGNFATNISGGSQFNYKLIWVILISNIMAIFLQTMSAKLGIATGKSLTELCGKIFSRRANWVFLIIAEFGAIATNLAEFLGSTLGLYLLFHIPVFYSALLAGVLTFALCWLEKFGQKVIEGVICALLSVIGLAYVLEVFLAGPDWTQVALGAIIPSLPNGDAVLIAVGMLGATVMPHVIYLHSQLVQCRGADNTIQGKRKHLRMEKIDIVIAMNVAFLVNAAMVIVSAAVFYKNGIAVTTIEQAKLSLEPILGSLSGGAFGIALLASGLSSSAVGTMAGQNIMEGFVGLSLPVNVRRVITILPALIIILIGINPMNALVLSQVTLSFILPVPIIQMLILSNKKDLMGEFANKPFVRVLGIAITIVIAALNAFLIILTLVGNV